MIENRGQRYFHDDSLSTKGDKVPIVLNSEQSPLKSVKKCATTASAVGNQSEFVLVSEQTPEKSNS